MLHKQLKPIAAVAMVAAGVLAGTNLSAQAQAFPGKPGGGMMGREGMPDEMMGRGSMMAPMSQMMESCSKMLLATPPAPPRRKAPQLQG
jgi:hypothetical protein